ncbi:hypothetical protein HD806DRAFT_548118 [Xylariaceae sp. AK1471]|nr:hypothetical protein HD806DRAFT_548118 [Xylariaceae sp. AK1471]
MAKKLGSEILAELVSPGSASHLAISDHEPPKKTSSDYEWWRALQQATRPQILVPGSPYGHVDHDQKSTVSYHPVPTTHVPQYGESDFDIVPHSQESKDSLPNTKLPQPVTTKTLGIPTQTAVETVFIKTRLDMGGLDVMLSLRGGGGDISWLQPKKLGTDKSGPYRFSSLSLSRGVTDEDPSSLSTLEPTPPRVLSSDNRINTKTTKQRSRVAFSSFENLRPSVQSATQGYLRGEAMTDSTENMDMPLMDMFLHLRLCVLLLCEYENPLLHKITRSPTKYAMFRDGLNKNFLEKDDDFVRKARAENPKLNLRLNRLSERLRIVFAFQTVNFPAIMAGGQDTDSDVGDGARKRKVDCIMLEDTEMAG